MERTSYEPDEILRKNINVLTPKDMLERIHINLNRSNYPLDEEKSKKVDEIMEKILEDGIINNLYNDAIKDKSEDKIRSEEPRIYHFIECQLITYYYALYNDNLDLYNKLVEKDVSFGDIPGGDRLYILNKELREMFDSDKEYFEFISMFDSAIGLFYNSLKNKNNETRKKCIDTFIDILKNNKDYLYEDKNNNKIYRNLLNKRNIVVFGKDFLENLNTNQKNTIDGLDYNLKPESLQKIKELLEKYPDFNCMGEDRLLQDTYLEMFTIDEIVKMSEENMHMYACALKEGLAKRLKRLLTAHPDFTCPGEFIKAEVFDNMDFETMAMLSPEAKAEIAKLRGRDIAAKVKKIARKDLRKTSNILKIFGKNNKSKEEKTQKKPTRRKV